MATEHITQDRKVFTLIKQADNDILMTDMATEMIEAGEVDLDEVFEQAAKAVTDEVKEVFVIVRVIRLDLDKDED